MGDGKVTLRFYTQPGGHKKLVPGVPREARGPQESIPDLKQKKKSCQNSVIQPWGPMGTHWAHGPLGPKAIFCEPPRW